MLTLPGGPFDPERAVLYGRDVFAPLAVEGTEPLADALAAGRVRAGARVLGVVRGGSTLALTVEAMALHHVAQGEAGDQPWVASF